ncbi:MAG TPA: glycosyltransferase family 4 protein [Actinomycetota bacterium]|nr:glycosyltransferase family 4 protein [Actinomycetota bacterium]
MADALLVTSSFLPGRGGIERYLAELCSQVAPRLAVLAPATRDGRPIPQDLGYPALPGPGTMLWPGRRVRDAIVLAALEQSVDRVVFGTPWPLALVGPSLREKGLRYSVIVHGAELLVPAAIPVVAGKLAAALSSAELLMPVSDFTARRIDDVLSRHGQRVPRVEKLRARIDIDRFTPSVDVGPLRSRWDIGPDVRVIVHFGRLVKRKGVHRLLGVLDKIGDRTGEIVLVIGGTGPEEKRLRAMAAQCRTRVIFAGSVPDSEAPALYALGDVFVLPVVDRYRGLETEGLGIVLLEASAAGVPSVTGRSGGTVEAVIDGVTGFHIDARDEAALIEKTSLLLREPSTAKEMGAAARLFVEENWSHHILPEPLLKWLG